MKNLDKLSAALLFAGGLHLGLLGLLDLNLINTIGGAGTPLMQAAYALVSLAVLEQAIDLCSAQRHSGISPATVRT